MNNLINLHELNWIVRWIYTKDEWQRFENWNARRKGIFNYIWHLLFHKAKPIQSIEFTAESVQVGNRKKYFNNSETELKRIDISEKGKINIMNITWGPENQLTEIRIPIPKGKLKEAMEVQERLMK